MERHPKNGTRRINNPFPRQAQGLKFVTGDLFFNATELASQSYIAGQGFEVRWHAEEGGSLQVYHQSEPKRELWKTLQGKSFISAAVGRDSFEESRGSFAIHDKVDIVCSHQTVEQITLAWPSETAVMIPEMMADQQSHRPLVKLGRDGKAEAIKSAEFESKPSIMDPDGTPIGNRGPSVIVSGCLYADPTLARHQLRPFSTIPSPTRIGAPAMVKSDNHRRRLEKMVSKDSRFTAEVPYWLVFYEAREDQLGFSVRLGRSRTVSLKEMSRKSTFLPEVMTVSSELHWLWSEIPVSAFSSLWRDSCREAVLPLRRSNSKVEEFGTIGGLNENSLTSTRSPVTPFYLSGLKFNTLFEFVHLLQDVVDESDPHFQQPTFNRVQLTYSSSKDENFFGFGEQFSHFNMKGRKVPIFVQEQGIGRGDQPVTALANLISNRSGGDWHTTYAPTPYYMTSAMRSLYLEGYEFALFDLTRHDAVQLQVHAGFMNGRILHGRTPPEIIQQYTAATGRMRELPSWILKGAIVGMQGGLHTVQKVWQQLQDLKVPLSAFWLQDWVGQRKTSVGSQLWWNWEVDRDHYPGWEQLVQEFRRHGIRTMTYFNPLLAPSDEKPNRQRDLFQEARDQDFLVGDQLGSPYMIPNTSFDAAMVDLTNPSARTWLKGILNDMAETGVRGWMADFGEALPLDSSLFSGESPRTMHNRYAEMWAELNREFAEEWEAKQKELKVQSKSSESRNMSLEDEESEHEDDDEMLVFFTRAGFRSSPRWSTLFWEGDQMVSWQKHDGIKSAVTGLLSGGLSGFSLNHSDIGGYCTVDLPFLQYRRSEELLLRWMEINAFSTIFRTHEGNVPGANSQFYSNEQTLHHFSRFAKVYNAWEFYRRTLVKEAASTGLPVVRHLFLHYPHDTHVQTFTYQQFLIGTEILVVPVLDKGCNQVKAYFPAGEVVEEWEHLWTGKVYSSSPQEGLTARINAPLGEPAVFTRKGSYVGNRFKDNLVTEGVLPS
ncbi:unnamed protein product [Calypogeia fissa]